MARAHSWRRGRFGSTATLTLLNVMIRGCLGRWPFDRSARIKTAGVRATNGFRSPFIARFLLVALACIAGFLWWNLET